MQLNIASREYNGPWFSPDGVEKDQVVPGALHEPEDQEENVNYEFYSKPMANPLVILQRSALPEGTKVATMTSKLKRRWKNTWEGAATSKFEDVTIKFMDNLAAMGYPLAWTQEGFGGLHEGPGESQRWGNQEEPFGNLY